MKESDSSESPLESLRKRLYGSGALTDRRERQAPSAKPQAPEHWQQAPQLPERPKRHISGSTLFLISAVAFFAIAGIATAVVLFLGGRSVSSENLEILIEGPTSVEGGDAVSLLVTIQNDNPVAVSGAVLSVDFPEGTYASASQTDPLRHLSEEVGDIPAGASVRKTIRASFFGSEGQKILVPMTVEYTTSDSNATFVKNKQYELVIGTAPVSLSVSTLSEVPSGQPFTLYVAVRSNAATPLENVAVRAEYPFGFRQTAAAPEPVAGSLFALGRLSPGEEKEIRIAGTLSGLNGEERNFRFTAGALGTIEPPALSVSYTEENAEVAIARPFLDVGLSINQSEEPAVVIPSGSTAQASLSWENMIPSNILDASISVLLSGPALNTSSVEANGGFYRSSSRTVVFSKETMGTLAELAPGAKGAGTFTFSTQTGSALTSLRNPAITLEVSVSGRRVGAGNVAETITSTINRTVKVSTDLTLESRAVRTIGEFSNTGPWPPKVDTESTYTILLMARNTVNSVANATTRMTLPPYVRFTGKISAGSGITYSDTSRQVTWTPGDMAAGTSREAAFQVALLPSVTQKGTSPVLVSEQTITGFDRFAQQNVTSTHSVLNTQITTDPAYGLNKGAVE